MKRNILIALSFMMLFSPNVYGKQASQRADILRKTYLNFAMGYTLRYFESDWILDREQSAFNVLLTSKFYPGITVNIWSDDAEKNLTQEQLAEKFKDSVSGFANCQIETNKEIMINGLNFLYYDSIITPSDYSKRMSAYMYSGKEGSLVFLVKTPLKITEEEKGKIASLINGFSFDGKACRGNRALRGAKTFLEFFSD